MAVPTVEAEVAVPLKAHLGEGSIWDPSGAALHVRPVRIAVLNDHFGNTFAVIVEVRTETHVEILF